MTALKRGEIDRLLHGWEAGLRLLLLAGPDEARSRDLCGRVVRQLADPDDALSVTDLAAAELASDAGRLADEAAAFSMFGGRRVIRVTGVGDAALESVRLLLDAPQAGNPVVMLAGDLPKTSSLRKLCEEAPAARVQLSYPPDAREAMRLLEQDAATLGLKLEAGVGARILGSCDGDVGVMAQELQKFALYLGASRESPKRLAADTLAALGADSAEEDLGALVSAVTAQNATATERQLQLLRGSNPVGAFRMMARRLFQLAEVRALVDRGQPPAEAVKAVRPPIFWKEQEMVAAAVKGWSQARIADGLRALLEAEEAVKSPKLPGVTIGWQTFLDLARR
jgi:DNA polymerase-3 subunit delta